ncbi:MAG: GTP pyrophosphokinase [Deltaproteobacteria bacterium]|nr:GTP pyrophosphokinase [Deltaproteobacteria bacterium]MBW2305457.1 GTP pyrophosphokinase [Deltaproteobacteria bacterium]
MATLDKAVLLAVQAHTGQKDKAGAPYILHPLRIMLQMRTETEMMAAVLHDVIEETDWTLDALRKEDFPEEVLIAIDCLSRKDGETYEEFIERVKHLPLAQRVKLADLKDNMNIRRLSNLTAKDMERLKKYHWAWLLLAGPEGQTAELEDKKKGRG